MYEMTLARICACSQIAPQGNRVLHIHWEQMHEASSVRVYDTDLHTSYVSNEQQEKLFYQVETGPMPGEYQELTAQLDCIDQRSAANNQGVRSELVTSPMLEVVPRQQKQPRSAVRG